eukprot:g9470.t1
MASSCGSTSANRVQTAARNARPRAPRTATRMDAFRGGRLFRPPGMRDRRASCVDLAQIQTAPSVTSKVSTLAAA